MPCSWANACARSREREPTATTLCRVCFISAWTKWPAIQPGPTTAHRSAGSPAPGVKNAGSRRALGNIRMDSSLTTAPVGTQDSVSTSDKYILCHPDGDDGEPKLG